jgi:hypothetical protein
VVVAQQGGSQIRQGTAADAHHNRTLGRGAAGNHGKRDLARNRRQEALARLLQDIQGLPPAVDPSKPTNPELGPNPGDPKRGPKRPSGHLGI